MRKHHIVEKEGEGERLDRYLTLIFPELSRRKAREKIAKGQIWLNGKPIKVMSRKVKRGDRITWLEREAEDLPNAEEKVDWEAYGGKPKFLYRDQYLAVIDKPPGIPTEPTPKEDLKTAKRQIEALLREEGLHPKRIYVTAVHRLDKDASGAVVFALKKSAARALSEQFAKRLAGRTYRAIVAGHPPKKAGQLRHHIGWTGPGIKHGILPPPKGKLAILNYRTIEQYPKACQLEIELQTGRTHQIRVQMSAIGHPLLGDWLYMPKELFSQYPLPRRLMLHAHRLSITHPTSGQKMTFEAPLPDDFLEMIETLSK